MSELFQRVNSNSRLAVYCFSLFISSLNWLTTSIVWRWLALELGFFVLLNWEDRTSRLFVWILLISFKLHSWDFLLSSGVEFWLKETLVGSIKSTQIFFFPRINLFLSCFSLGFFLKYRAGRVFRNGVKWSLGHSNNVCFLFGQNLHWVNPN